VSFILDQAKSRLAGLALLWLLGLITRVPPVTASDPEIPRPVRTALENNAAALNRITVSWERKRSSTLPLPELLERLRCRGDTGFLEPCQVRYTSQDGMFHAFTTYRERDPDQGVRQHRTEVAFDRTSFFVATPLQEGEKQFPPVILQVTPFAVLIKEQADRHFWDPEYFHEAGFELPGTHAAMRQPPKSQVLALLDQGARLSKVWEECGSDDASCTVVELTTQDRMYRFDLDPALLYAVRRYEERDRSGARAVVTNNSDFVRLRDLEIWLPKRCRAEWHTWRSVPDQVSPTSLVVVDITASELTRGVIPGETFQIDYNSIPGAFIADGRLPGADQKPSGRITYFVSVDPADLEEGVRDVMERGRFAPRPRRSGLLWGVAAGLSFAAAVAALGMLGWLRKARRAIEPSSDS